MEMEAMPIVSADDTLPVPVRVRDKTKALPPGTYAKFADSPLWDLQRQYYKKQGLATWSQGKVPSYLTSNPFFAKAYADIALGFWRDLKAQGKTTQPLYIIELGAGSGRFAYHFLLHFFEAFDAIRGPDDKVCYVMTDFAPKTVQQWQKPLANQLKPFVEQGRLDFALFDAEKSDAEKEDEAEADIQLHLQQQKVVLSPNSLALPPIVIANYVFSGLRQDLFFLENERIYEGWLALTTEDSEGEAQDNPNHPFQHLKLDYQKRRITSLPYTQHRNSVIENFAKRLPPCALLFPSCALNAITRLGRLHGGPLLLLSADRSTHELKQLAQQQEPDIALHGSFSLPVNYHAIASVIQHQGGSCWTNTQNEDLAVFVACWQAGKSAEQTPPWRETELATKQALRKFSPGDFYRIKQTLQTEAEYLNPEQMLAFLRLSRWDAKIFYLMFAYIYDDLAQLPAQQQHEWHSALAKVWRYHLPIGEDYDLAYDLALLAAELNRWPSAIYLLLLSLEHPSQQHQHNQSSVYFNLGIAHWQIAAHSEAESYLVRALALAEAAAEEDAKNQSQAVDSQNSQAIDESIIDDENNSADAVEDSLDEDDEDFDSEDDDFEDDDITDAEENTAASQVADIREQLTQLRAWQAQCQTLLGAQTLQSATSAYPKTLYATLLGPHHAQALYRLQRDPKLAALAGVECLQNTEHARAWIQQEQSQHKHILAVLHPEFGLIGVAALECPPQALQSGGSRSGRFYYWIGEEFQWQGYGTQAMKLLHQLASRLGVLHIFSTVDQTNIASQRALAKLGYQRLPFELIGERPGYRFHHFGQTTSEAALYPILAQLLTELASPTSLAPLNVDATAIQERA